MSIIIIIIIIIIYSVYKKVLSLTHLCKKKNKFRVATPLNVEIVSFIAYFGRFAFRIYSEMYEILSLVCAKL